MLDPTEEGGQDLGASAPIITFESTPQNATAEIDLTEPYAEHAKKLMRTFMARSRF